MVSIWFKSCSAQPHTANCDIVVQDYEAMLAASKEEQHRLLQVVEQWKKMCYARDMQVSQLQSEQLLDKCECEYLHLVYITIRNDYSISTQIYMYSY